MITVDIFKSHFVRDFPYLPEYVEGKAYFKGDVVYVSPNFYVSLIDGNLAPVTDNLSWSLYKDSTENYLSDTDIQKAICEASISFNESLFDDETLDCNNEIFSLTDKDFAMLYLSAFYLVMDIRNSTAGLSSNAYAMFTSSKSVGSVSESYGLPSWVNNSPLYAMYMTNGYGMKYLSFLIPRVTGFIHLSAGGTTVG